MKTTLIHSLNKSISYPEYRLQIKTLLTQNLSTGNLQTEDLLHYSKLNETRMNRLEKTSTISSEILNKIAQIKKDYILLTLSEGWCGDAAQIVPVLNKVAQNSSKLELKLVFRDENDALMQLFLTNNSKSIPKVILINAETLEIKGNWGPRPKGASELIKSYKSQYGIVDETAKTELQLWYLHDKGLSIQNEIIDLILHIEQLGK